MEKRTPPPPLTPLSDRMLVIIRVLHKEAWVATLLGIQDYKKVNFQGRDKIENLQ